MTFCQVDSSALVKSYVAEHGSTWLRAIDQVMEKADEAGNVVGFSVLRISALKKAPLEVAL